MFFIANKNELKQGYVIFYYLLVEFFKKLSEEKD